MRRTHVVLKKYLRRLRKAQAKKPLEQRKPVPRLKELAQALGVTQTGLSKFVNNQNVNLSLNMLDPIMAYLADLGFNPTYNDLLEFTEDENPN